MIILIFVQKKSLENLILKNLNLILKNQDLILKNRFQESYFIKWMYFN